MQLISFTKYEFATSKLGESKFTMIGKFYKPVPQSVIRIDSQTLSKLREELTRFNQYMYHSDAIDLNRLLIVPTPEGLINFDDFKDSFKLRAYYQSIVSFQGGVNFYPDVLRVLIWIGAQLGQMAYIYISNE